jgi:hypothetical protein
MINKILQGWKRILQDYRHWKMIIKYPYCDFDCLVFFGNLAQPPNSLEDYIKEYKQLDPEYEKIMYDNLWELYDDVEERMKETDKFLEEVDEVLK